ncbi:MAG: stress response protein [Gloeocapsa sp. DLM2.Bin57]|nr:MAG: stress response protein [Gloeocapsa sp. DLM2.Bin57]
MVELKAKITLDQKGEQAFISIKQLLVKLTWTASVDLDLMAFYEAKDGRTGGVISDNYPGGTLGNLNEFPYMQLSGDEGVGAQGGDNEEVIRISRLDDLATVYICTINYTDAIEKKESSFSQYDGGVIVIDEKGDSIAIPLNSDEPGHVAVIAKIDNTSPIGAKLSNENRIISLDTFAATIPGSHVIVG